MAELNSLGCECNTPVTCAHTGCWKKALVPEATNLYTCIGKGGTYERLGIATGAGTSKTQDPVVVYREVNTGRLFYRAESDFDARMERLR